MSQLPYVSYLVLLLLLVACNGSQTKIDESSAKFTTSDASELFFKNVRAISYDKTTMDEAKLDIYRIKERVDLPEEPILDLSIVVNWRYDEAYILTEPNAFLQQMDTLYIVWKDTTQVQGQGAIQFIDGNKAEHFRLATQIYRNIQTESPMFILHEGEQHPFMHKKNIREPFRKTMVDYFRLVDLM